MHGRLSWMYRFFGSRKRCSRSDAQKDKPLKMFELIMTTAKIAVAVAFASLFGQCQAQELTPLFPMDTPSAVVAAQTSSLKNYALLQPIASEKVVAIASNNTARLSNNESSVELADVAVIPHSFKRGVFDVHKFMVRNDGKNVVSGARVLFSAPLGSIVQQVVPKPDMVEGSSVEITVQNLAPGAHKIVEIAIKYSRNEFASFETKVTAGSWGTTESNVVADSVESTQTLPPPSTGMLQPKIPVLPASATIGQAVQELSVEDLVLPVAAMSTRLERTTQSTSRDKSLVPTFASTEQNTAKENMTAEVVKSEAAMSISVIESLLTGPKTVAIGEEVEYAIEVKNVSSETARGIIVQLAIPEELNVTVLDRSAWFDQESRKLSWELAQLDGKATETIRYKAVVNTECSVGQEVITGMGGTFQCKTTIQTSAK